MYSPAHAQIDFCLVSCGLYSHVPSALIQTPLSGEDDSGTPAIGVKTYIYHCQSQKIACTEVRLQLRFWLHSCWYCAIGNMNIQSNIVVMYEELFIAIFCMFMLSIAQYQHLHLYFNENMNFRTNDDFRFWNIVLLNQKLKKQKYNQNLDLNLICGVVEFGCKERKFLI